MTALSGRVAFITGAAGGIGLGIAHALSHAGVRLALADREPEALDQARADLGDDVPVATFAFDVRDRDRFAAAVDAAEAELGPVSLLFNNAGVAGAVPPSQMTFELWDWVIDINLGGVVNGIQTVVPRMIERGRPAHIVNTASLAGLRVDRSGFMYHASKYAVVGLSESLRKELARRDIGVSVLCPGPVDTAIVDTTASSRPERSEIRSSRMAEIDAAMRAALKAGPSPERVGELVLEGVLANREYIFTEPDVDRKLRPRVERLLAEAQAQRG